MTLLRTLYQHANLATCHDGAYHIIEDAALVVQDGVIAWLGPMQDLKSELASQCQQTTDVDHRWIVPSFIDCHTHLVYAGTRYQEFAARCDGKSYADIAERGGGIQNTVRATRAASLDELFALSAARVEALMAEGVGIIEIKSGYGLGLESELKQLQVAEQLNQHYPLTIKKTLLAAHALPPEFEEADSYIDFICKALIPHVAVENLADAVDVFCDVMAFNVSQAEKLFQAAKAHNLAIKCHAEQLSNTDVAVVAAQYGALSCDHLEYISKRGIAAMQKAGTVAVLLPGAYYYLQAQQKPPVAELRAANVPMAIATDCNPGSSPTTSLLLTMNMACQFFGLSPEEALAGVTIHAAQALGMAHAVGSLRVGKKACFNIWDIQHPSELSARMTGIPEVVCIR